MAVEQFLSHYGLAAVALGAAFEGETAVIAGGLLAHRGLWPLGGAMLAAFLGSFAADQMFFAVGRTCRGMAWVQRLQRRAAFAKALDVFHRHPTGFILAFRFLYGLRIVSPVAIGTTRIPARRFLALNLIAAAIWAPLFTILGYSFGKGLERWFGGRHVPLWAVGVGVLALVGGGFAIHLLIQRRRR
ncbi:DedA family protein [Sphingomonas naphthae]|uniref:DedA family protein n=1 Tax=Sphingomonas naphthae TaxID=1813468 RepID=A0ABY7TPE4_9SPHN|nr:DedA family protein [Sphingomonas naphthae]WCT74968.1 DedA family protein [Sphingomonas naphthae]